jgi:membrane protease YdiL (CAAX protease family)
MSSTASQLGPLSLWLRLLGTLVPAIAAAWALDRLCQRKGLLPPGFRRPGRRAAAFLLVTFVFWVGIFRPLGELGLEVELDLSKVSAPQLFLLHVLMAAAVLGWFALGFAGLGRVAGAAPASGTAPAAGAAPVAAPPPSPSFARQLAAQLGLVAANVPREVLIGLLLGVLAWAAVLLVLAIAVAVWAMSGGRPLPKPSAIVPWIAALPVAVRLAVSLSAGFVEESFFRGFLQPRVGIVLSSLFFVLAHVSYRQPFMLLGVLLLSMIYALLVRWRQTIWPAIAAHALFDGIQLLVIIPAALRLMGQPEGAKSALRLLAGACGGIW